MVHKIKIPFLISVLLIFGLAGTGFAKKEVRFASVSWTGVTVKTELGVSILESLGYKASNTMVSVPIVYKALDTDEADVFLGNWMPSMATIANKYFDKGTVVKYVASMPGAKYTLAAPSYVVDGGLDDFKDIHKYADKLDRKIYGIEEGNDGNQVIQSMIDNDMFNLGDFEVVSSSEAGMLSQVKSYVKDREWIVFLGWSPHYMNEIIDMKYLKGSTSETFGANDGTATVYTNIRKGFDKEYPNVAVFLKNFKFPVSMLNSIMKMLKEDDSLDPETAGLEWIKEHPEVYEPWFENVKTVDGKPGLDAFKKFLESV